MLHVFFSGFVALMFGDASLGISGMDLVAWLGHMLLLRHTYVRHSKECVN